VILLVVITVALLERWTRESVKALDIDDVRASAPST